MARRAKSPAVKQLTGNPGRRKLKRSKSTDATAGAEQPPEWLGELAREEWLRVVGELKRLGVYHQLDQALLAGYCEAYERWRRAQEATQKHGFCYERRDQDGQIAYIGTYPEVSIAAKALDQMRRLAAELGITPRGRADLAVGRQEADPFDAYLDAEAKDS